MTNSETNKIEFGDFQTPPDLANRICQKLNKLGIQPEVVIEPTCGIGAFVQASFFAWPSVKKIISIDINERYLNELTRRKSGWAGISCVEIIKGDFFAFDWQTLFDSLTGSVLVLGNFPWVTNSQQGEIDGTNLPQKHNFRNYNGMDAITGKSNFDISEWMLIHIAKFLQPCNGSLAMICKSSVARKFLNYLQTQQVGLSYASLFGIDAKRYFGVSVESCLLVCQFQAHTHFSVGNSNYRIYADLESEQYDDVAHRHGLTIRDIGLFEKHQEFFGVSGIKWRSGVKHDCSTIMELQQHDDLFVNGAFVNGAGEKVDVETSYLYPLLKGSDVANNRVTKTSRYLIIPQKTVGEETRALQQQAPKLWKYLESHAHLLDNRKSRIYQNNPRFSIFGVGPYSFAGWKIAICSLYKNLHFRLIGEIDQKPVLFDDTVYFASFDNYREACDALEFLNSQSVQEFLSSLIFWDEKRPIKTSILHCLNLQPAKMTKNLSLFSFETE